MAVTRDASNAYFVLLSDVCFWLVCFSDSDSLQLTVYTNSKVFLMNKMMLAVSLFELDLFSSVMVVLGCCCWFFFLNNTGGSRELGTFLADCKVHLNTSPQQCSTKTTGIKTDFKHLNNISIIKGETAHRLVA